MILMSVSAWAVARSSAETSRGAAALALAPAITLASKLAPVHSGQVGLLVTDLQRGDRIVPHGFEFRVPLVPFPPDDLVRVGDPGRFPVACGDSCPAGVVRLEERLQSGLASPAAAVRGAA